MRFVVQSPTITLHHLMHLHQLCHADQGQQFMQVNEHAYYLPGQKEPSPEALAFCAEQGLFDGVRDQTILRSGQADVEHYSPGSDGHGFHTDQH